MRIRIKEKMHSAAEFAKNTKEKAKGAVEKVSEIANKGKDSVAAIKVDFEAARKDDKFEKFLLDTDKKLDWTKDQWQIREAFVLFERSKKVTEKYQGLFEGKLKDIVKDNSEAKNEIAAHMLELAKSDPEKLRQLEKQLGNIEKGEKEISEKQSEIDKFKEKGGKEGIAEKIDTLKKAKSIGRVLAQYSGAHRLFGFGKDKMLAFEKAKKEYGLVDRESMKKEIKSAKGDLGKIEDLEAQKVSAKSKYHKERSQVFLDNDTAKRVQEKIKDQILTRFGDVMKASTLADFKSLSKFTQEVKTQFAEEGKKERSGLSKTFSKDKATKGIDFLNLTEDNIKNMEALFDQQIQKRIEQDFERIVQKTPVDKFEDEIGKYLKQSEFAGQSRTESASKVFKTFMKLKEALDPKSSEAVKMSLVLSKLEYLTV